MSYKILIINPGSTSTKIGVYEDETQLMEETLRHSTEEIAQYATIYDQKDFRKEVILKVLEEKNVDLSTIDVVVGRGGLLKPIPGGTYATTPELLEDLKQSHELVITLEDGILRGGFGESIASFYGDSDMKVLNYGLKKEFLDRYNPEEIVKANRLTPEQIAEDVCGIIG